MDSTTATPLPLEYQAPGASTDTPNPVIVRIVAAATAVALLVVVGYFLMRSQYTLGGIDDWILPIAAAAGGACYMVLVSVDLAGRRRPRRINTVRLAAIWWIFPVLIADAIGMIVAVNKDPYAWTRDYVEWYAASACLFLVGFWLLHVALLRPPSRRDRYFRLTLSEGPESGAARPPAE